MDLTSELLRKANAQILVDGLKMKYVLLFLLLLLDVSGMAQEKTFLLRDLKLQETKKVRDSAAAVKFLDSLTDSGYYFTRLISAERKNGITEILYDRGNNYRNVIARLSDEVANAVAANKEIRVDDLDSLKSAINDTYRAKGFVFNRVRSKYIGMKGELPVVEISVDPQQVRKITGFVIEGYDKVPTRFVKNLEKEYGGKIYNDQTVRRISQSQQNHPFVLEERAPQTLFTKDSTNIYLYLQKRKSSSFDGVLGFGNDEEGKFTLNGTVDIALQNMFNGFEKLSLYWQRNPDKGQTFDLRADIPYLFKSNLGFNGNLNIFRQDSTYANVKVLPSVYYHIGARQKLGLRGNFEISSVLVENYVSGDDYRKAGGGLWYEYVEASPFLILGNRAAVLASADLLKTNYGDGDRTPTQTAFSLAAERSFHLTGNHYIHAKADGAMLRSGEELMTNELLRFGGWNSLRGFNENSIIANLYGMLSAEYRYLIGEDAFLDVFTQFAGVRNDVLKIGSQLYSFGMGLNIRLPFGIMSVQLSNGSQVGRSVRFSDTKIHWGVVTRF